VSAENRPLWRIEKLIQAALRDFVTHEDETRRQHPASAVRAAQFNEYIRTHYPILVKEMTPDLCEQYLKKYHFIKVPVDEAPEEDKTPLERYKAAREAYNDFHQDVGFKGSKAAKVFAFHQYVVAKYPNSLPDFSEEEARNVVEGRAPESAGGKRGYLKYLIATVCAAALGAALLPLAMPEEKPRPRTPAPDRRLRDDDGIHPKPLRDPNFPQWQLPPGRFPQVGPQIGPLLPDNGLQWQDRVDPPVNDDKKKEKDR
jgi:hypothetical protein